MEEFGSLHRIARGLICKIVEEGLHGDYGNFAFRGLANCGIGGKCWQCGESWENRERLAGMGNYGDCGNFAFRGLGDYGSGGRGWEYGKSWENRERLAVVEEFGSWERPKFAIF